MYGKFLPSHHPLWHPGWYVEENKVYKLTSNKEDEMANTETAPSNHTTERLWGCSQQTIFFLEGSEKKKRRNGYAEPDKLPGHRKSYKHVAR